MDNKRNGSLQELENILRCHMTGRKEYPGEEIMAVCETLAERTALNTDAAGVYRHYLEVFLPEDIKKTSES